MGTTTSTVLTPPPKVFDSDQHYYEATDAFTRHLPKKMRRRTMQWAEINGRQRLLVAGKVNNFIPNPTFDPCSKPGALINLYRGTESIETLAKAFGELDPISPAYRNPVARVKVMDEQGLESAFLFPTLGVGMEPSLVQDVPALLAAFTSFNRWLLEDWQFNYQDRLYAAPYITLVDVDHAIEELEFALKHDAKIINIRPSPIYALTGNRSFGDPAHDPFWARVNESGITVGMHAGDASYGFLLEAWGARGDFQAFRLPAFFQLLTMSPISDSIASFIADGVFKRFPNIRLASVENGADWVPTLVHKLNTIYKMRKDLFDEHPVETLRRHVWISPYYENDLEELSELIGVDRIIFGSDWPHAEGLAKPLDYINDLSMFNQEEVNKIMFENANSLIQAKLN